MDILLLSIIIAAAIVLLVTQVIRVELTAFLIIVSLPALGLLTPAEAVTGFSNEATITVAAMFMLSQGLFRTGALDYITRYLSRLNFKRPTQFLVAIGVIVVVPSAFLNNTAVVIMLIPVVLRLCQKHDIVPSKLMIPLSYFAILGGTLTLIGTSTNILVDSLYRQSGGPGFGMFEFTPMGVCYLLIGGIFLLFFSYRLLPERKVLSQLIEPQHRTNFVTEIVVPEGNKLAGSSLENLLGGAEHIRILEIVRGEEVLLGPEPSTTIKAGDNLLIEGSPKEIHRLLERQKPKSNQE